MVLSTLLALGGIAKVKKNTTLLLKWLLSFSVEEINFLDKLMVNF